VIQGGREERDERKIEENVLKCAFYERFVQE